MLVGLALGLCAVAWLAVQVTTRPRASTWLHGAPLLQPRDDFGLVAVNGKLWAVGGITGLRGDALRSVEVFDPTAGRWVSGPPMPTPRGSAGVAVLGQTIYVAGGLTSGGAVSDVVESLDTATGEWVRRAPLPAPRMQLTAVAVDGRVWAIGGNDASGPPLGTVDVYDPAVDRWSTSAPLPTPRYGLAAAIFDGRVYVAGGQDSFGPVAAVEFISPPDTSWYAGPPLPEGLTRLGLASAGGQLRALAGVSHFALSSGATGWERVRAMPTSRHGLAAVALNGTMYAIGGCSDDLVDLGVNEVFTY